MKILIPTVDGLSIAPDFESATAFRLLDVMNGEVRGDVIKPGAYRKSDFILPALSGRESSDQHTVITRGIMAETEADLQKSEYEIFHTEEANIINALMFYLKNYAIRESNYCCCP
jgi:hypothetical protein